MPVGATIYRLDAPDTVDVLALIIKRQLLASSRMIFAFPTVTQGIIDTLLTEMQPMPIATHE